MTDPHVVIIGGGFGGLSAARELKHAPVRVTLIDRSNHHLFQPLLYQVATAGLSPADIAAPIRGILRHQPNADVLMAEVTGIDKVRKLVIMNKDGEKISIPYDFLIVATGARHSYFGHEEWSANAPGLKTIVDATAIRRKILLAFESAEMELNPERKQPYLTFVIVGGGPTGVELAGSIAELAHKALKADFRYIDPKATRIILIEAGSKLLAAFPKRLSQGARDELGRLGVEVMTDQRVEHVDEQGVVVSGQRILAKTVIWAAGVIASPAGKWLEAETDRAGRVNVGEDLSIAGHPEIFVIGDVAAKVQDGKPLPGVSPVAMQEGRYVGRLIANRIKGLTTAPFRYFNKGNMATVGRAYAVCDLGPLKIRGFLAWVLWVFVHIYYLIGFRTRIVVLLEWAWAYLTFQRGARLITLDRDQ